MNSIRREVAEQGFAMVPGLRTDAAGEEIAEEIGDVLQLGDGSPVHRIVPTDKEAATSNTYSGLYGLESFPFHTDMAHWRHPPRFMMLRCVVGFLEVPTLLLDGAKIVREAGTEVLSRALVQPRRPVKGKMPLLRLYQPDDEFGVVRWDEVFIRPASRAGKIGVERFRSVLQAASASSIPLSAPGDTLVIDNWRMLHARSPVPSHCAGRILERAYMERLH